MVPRNLSNELLNPLPLLIMQVRDSLTGLSFQPRHQPGDVLGSMTPVLGSREVLSKRLNELLQPRQHASKNLRGDLRLIQHLVQSRLESAFHDILLLGNLRDGRECRKEG